MRRSAPDGAGWHAVHMATNPTTIDVPFPGEEALQVRIALGPCRVRIARGAGGAWASGRYEDPTGFLPLAVTREAGRLSLSHTPAAGTPSHITRAPSLDLQLGTARPYQLILEGGANETVADLGGLPLTRLTVRHGAGKSDLDFSAPNPGEMAELDVASGGVAMDLRNLANANFARMSVAGGAAQYRLDFGGQLRRDGEVRLNTGVASIELSLPAATPAVVRSESILGGLTVGDGFVTRQGAYWNEAAAAGRTPRLTIAITSVLGAVKVQATS